MKHALQPRDIRNSVTAGLFPEGQEEQLPCQVQAQPDISGQWAISMERLQPQKNCSI